MYDECCLNSKGNFKIGANTLSLFEDYEEHSCILNSLLQQGVDAMLIHVI